MNTNGRNNFAMRRTVQTLLMLTLLAYPLLPGPTNNAALHARALQTPNNAEYAMANTSPVGQNYQPGDIKVVAEGFHSRITKPFVAVVRDAETYAALTRLDENLPKLDADFFKENVAIAAFLGERNTGGYSVEIRANAIEILVLEKKPGKGMMVPQMITSPFKLVSIPVGDAAPVALSVEPTFEQRAQTYKVTSGSFKIMGGVGGRGAEFRLAGEMQTMREADLITVSLELKSVGTPKERTLNDYATGLIKNDRLIINKLSDGGLVDSPSGGLRAEGDFLPNNKLSLKLIGFPIMVPDGYTGSGSIEAEMIAGSAN
jgi:hypothetical protein